LNKEISEAEAWKHINQMFGGDLRHPDELEKVSTFTTRSPSLDRALQVGGWARGRVYQMAGKPSSGKTFMSLVAMAEWQSLDPENCCAFIDAEFTYDPIWAASLGVDNNRVMLIKTNDGEKIFTGLVGTPKKNKATGKVTKIPGLLDMIRDGSRIAHKVGDKAVNLNLGKMGVIILDSVAAVQSPAEAESAVGKINVSPLSRFLTVELKSLTPAVAHANVCFIAINHVKTAIGVLYGNPETTPGGAAWKHACSVMLMVAPISGSDNQLSDSNEEKFGHKIRIKVEKNKLGPPYKKAEFFIDFTSGVTKVEEQLLDLGCMYDVIQRPNSRSYIIGEKTLTSRALALDYVAEHKDKIEDAVRECYLSGKQVTLSDEDTSEFPDSSDELFVISEDEDE